MRVIREERTRDHAAIRVVHRAAFGRDDEGRLVDRLREDGLLVASLVAEDGDLVVGHVAFSDLRIDTPKGCMLAVALAPVGVLPQYQRQGIGSALIREGMALCREQARAVAAVVGEPDFYSRFGFSSGLGKRLTSAYSNLGPAWMAAELTPRALEDLVGLARYPEAFRLLEE
jgi:putative acetyltransferase